MNELISSLIGLLVGILVALAVLALGVLWVAFEIRCYRHGFIVRPPYQTRSQPHDRDRTDYV